MEIINLLPLGEWIEMWPRFNWIVSIGGPPTSWFAIYSLINDHCLCPITAVLCKLIRMNLIWIARNGMLETGAIDVHKSVPQANLFKTIAYNLVKVFASTLEVPRHLSPLQLNVLGQSSSRWSFQFTNDITLPFPDFIS